jgi:hypothetical protein
MLPAGENKERIFLKLKTGDPNKRKRDRLSAALALFDVKLFS